MQYFILIGKSCREYGGNGWQRAKGGRFRSWIRISLATVALLAWAGFAGAVGADEAALLRVGVQNERPPFSFSDDDGELQGFDVDIAWALCAALKAECRLVPLEFTALMPGLEEGRIDAAVASMSITEERLQRVDFTDKYYQASNRFVARRDARRVTPSGLAGKTIGVKRDTIHDRYLSDQFASTADIRRYGYSDEIFIDLALGRLDLTFADGITLTESFLKTDLGAEFDFVGPELSDPQWFGRGEGIAVRKGNFDLLMRLNRALRQILADGTYEEIRTKYFDYDIYGDALRSRNRLRTRAGSEHRHPRRRLRSAVCAVRAGSPGGLRRPGDVVVKHVRLVLELLQAMLDHVADADDADHPAVLHHRQMTEPPFGHLAHQPVNAVVRRAGADLLGHQSATRMRNRSAP